MSGLPKLYVLEGTEVVPFVGTLQGWLRSRHMRRIKATEASGVEVITVFIGVGSPSDEHGGPKVFETMVYVNSEMAGSWKSSTYEGAIEQHERACALKGIQDEGSARSAQGGD